MKNLSAPVIDRYISRFGRGEFTFDSRSTALIDELFALLDKIAPCGDDERREVWLRAPRRGIDNFGDYDEFLAEGEVPNREEFPSLWLEEYPEEIKR